jgi:hypothetical protein
MANYNAKIMDMDKKAAAVLQIAVGGWTHTFMCHIKYIQT